MQLQGPSCIAPSDGGQQGLCDPGLPPGRPRLQAIALALPAPRDAEETLRPPLARPQGASGRLPSKAAHRPWDDQLISTSALTNKSQNPITFRRSYFIQ